MPLDLRIVRWVCLLNAAFGAGLLVGGYWCTDNPTVASAEIAKVSECFPVPDSQFACAIIRENPGAKVIRGGSQ